MTPRSDLPLPPLRVRALDAGSVERAREWAARLGVPCGTGLEGELELRIADGAVASLGFGGDPRRGAVVALASGPRGPSAGADPLLRAIGLGRGVRTVLDATAGIGRDAATLAARGLEVTMVERHPVLAALLSDALARWSEGSLRLRVGDARDVLRGDESRGQFDAIYLDPMFPDRGKTALPRNDGQILRALLGEGKADDAGDAELLALARRRAVRRVVVKRAPRAPVLGGVKPEHVVRGVRVRFDVYGPADGGPQITPDAGRGPGAR